MGGMELNEHTLILMYLYKELKNNVVQHEMQVWMAVDKISSKYEFIH